MTTSRQSGFGLGYIPYSEITKHLDEWHIYGMEERLEWIDWIQTIDRIYVKLQSEEQKKKEKKDKPNAARGGKKTGKR